MIAGAGSLAAMPEDSRSTLAEVIGANVRRLREESGLTQAEFASELEFAGLPFQRGAVAVLEAGNRKLDLVELIVIAHVLNTSLVALSDDGAPLGRSTAWLTPGVVARLGYVRLRLAGNPARRREPMDPEIPRRAYEVLDLFNETQEERDARPAEYARRFPGFTFGQAAMANLATRSESERRSAARAGVDVDTFVTAAVMKWGHSLSDERDLRVRDATTSETDPRSVQALRGHVTRSLLAELEPILKEVD